MKNPVSKFIFGESYNKEVKSLLASDGNVDVSVAFVGVGADTWFRGKKTTYRVIVNLASGATNPSEIEKIVKRKNCEIKQLDHLHAKVFISRTLTIVGSANLSANGLGLEGSETASLEEAGIITSTDSSSSQWFEDKWSQSRKISKNDLKEAHEKWVLRYANRPVEKKNGSIDFLKNRSIGLLVSWEKIDPETKKVADDIFEAEEINNGLKLNKDVYAYYDFGINNKYIYLDYWIRKQGKGELVCNGVALPMTPKRKYEGVEYLLHDNKISHHGIYLKEYQSRITKLLKGYLKNIKLPKRDGGIIVELDDILCDGQPAPRSAQKRPI
jgi:hypothetical protein